MTRASEIVLALLLFVLSLPVLLLLALLIRLDSRGPAVFRQLRLGQGERPFWLLKLRTMKTGTGDHASHLAPADSITRAGRWLRRMKLDELPQLINVLRGEMSFVGPRPGLPAQIELRDARRDLGVFAVRPGITGLAQVRGVDMSDPLLLAAIDSEYLDHRSLAGDMRLLLATVTGSGRGDAAEN